MTDQTETLAGLLQKLNQAADRIRELEAENGLLKRALTMLTRSLEDTTP